LSEIPAKTRVYVDETGMDQDDLYAYGWSAKGERCHGRKPGGSKRRVSIIAGLSGGKLVAPFYFEGYTDSEVFNAWLREVLLPEIGAGKTIIMDNARFHKSAETRRIIEDAGCRLLYLSPYSPDFNPIEHRWFPIKNTARKIMQTITCVTSAIHSALTHPYQTSR